MVNAPDVVYADCPDCKDVTLHDVLKGKMGKSTLEATVRCQECERVHATVLRQPEILTVPVVISDGKESFRTTTELESDDLLLVGDEFFVEDQYVKITALELDQERRVEKAPAPEIRTIWAKKFDKLKIKVSVNKVHRTYSRVIEAVPDEEFAVGDTMRFGVDEVVIHGIKVQGKMVRRGAVEARKIVRMYGKIVRRVYD
jgi:uncharacterized Zn finger protein